RPQDNRTWPRKRRKTDASACSEDDPAAVQQSDSRSTTRRSGIFVGWCEGRVQHRFLCRASGVFSGRQHWDSALNRTVNDLSMCGARPQYLSASLIIEEGLPMDDLWRILCAMRNAADRAGVALVTGDTKVIDRGKGDKIFINTSGIGVIPEGVNIDP